MHIQSFDDLVYIVAAGRGKKGFEDAPVFIVGIWLVLLVAVLLTGVDLPV